MLKKIIKDPTLDKKFNLLFSLIFKIPKNIKTNFFNYSGLISENNEIKRQKSKFEDTNFVWGLGTSRSIRGNCWVRRNTVNIF